MKLEFYINGVISLIDLDKLAAEHAGIINIGQKCKQVWNAVKIDDESVDPFLSVTPLRTCADLWKGDLDVHDWRISPIYGNLKGIRNTTVFVGTDGIIGLFVRSL